MMKMKTEFLQIYGKHMTIADFGLKGYKGKAYYNEIKIKLLEKESQAEIEYLKTKVRDLSQQLDNVTSQLMVVKCLVVCREKKRVEIQTIQNWLEKHQLEKYYENFIINGFDKLQVIREMTDDDLKLIGIHATADRKRLLQLVSVKIIN